MKLFAAARLLLRLLRDLRQERHAIATELKALNRSLEQLVLIHARQANYLPPSPQAREIPTKPPDWALGKDDAQLFAEAETIRRRLIEQLGREPFDEELWQAIEGEMGRRESRV